MDFYKEHRAILDSDVIHVRRPDGQDYDGLLHVNPQLDVKGLLMLYNPLEQPIKKSIDLNLYKFLQSILRHVSESFVERSE